MDTKSVITGDIVASTTIKAEWRDSLLATLREIANEMKGFSSLEMEFFRGDSFQMVIDKPELALKIAILLRAGLKASTPPSTDSLWDARMAIGVGTISYRSEKIVVSDGEAFRLSGRGLDEMDKERLSVRTCWDDVNEEMAVSTAFADDIISSWSVAQAQVVYATLSRDIAQKDLAVEIGKSAQSVSKLLGVAKENLIRLYLGRYFKLVTTHIAAL
ncbi:MAG: hypothetical protein LBN29_13745 [Mediterranea sp.]|jgi:hypothetical protein|nr:hypothetical protein [Mediterranea sp.]